MFVYVVESNFIVKYYIGVCNYFTFNLIRLHKYINREHCS